MEEDAPKRAADPEADVEGPPVSEGPNGLIPELLPVRMVNEYVYCPRLFYLEWVQGEWADNAFTEDGHVVHRRADRETGKAPPPPEVVEPPPFTARSVSAASPRLGLSTRIDVVEGEHGEVVPVEYKRGKPPKRLPERAYEPERVQVCAQALVLRDNGYVVPRGEIYFAGSRERVVVELTDDLVTRTEAAAAAARATAACSDLPPPLIDSPKCDGCSLVGICLPDEVNALHPHEPDRAVPAELDAHEPPEAGERDPADGPFRAPVRRLHPARDDALPLYVQQGATRLGVEGGVLVVKSKERKLGEARLEHTSHVSIFGGVQVSTQAIRRLLERDIPLTVFSAGGWFYGWARGLGSKNVDLRRAQFRRADDRAGSLQLARRFVATKIANQRTLLRRNHAAPDGRVLERLSTLRGQATAADSVPSLLGFEGTAARLYFEHFPGMLKQPVSHFHPDGRNRRPPTDPINALLSFTYALLTKDWTIACAVAGFDPYLGFFHRPRHGRPSLALDLMEEFRPLVADSVVINVVNNGVVTSRDFTRRGLGVALKEGARKRVISVYERRMDELITHPVFGYRISYRRTFEVQARLLGRYLLGEIESFPEFLTR